MARVSLRSRYRFRTPSTTREVVIEGPEPGRTYVDRRNGESMQVVAELLPLPPSPSNLPCDQLAQKDLNDCPHCGRRMAPLAAQD
jgi:hypothetical protein